MGTRWWSGLGNPFTSCLTISTKEMACGAGYVFPVIAASEFIIFSPHFCSDVLLCPPLQQVWVLAHPPQLPGVEVEAVRRVVEARQNAGEEGGRLTDITTCFPDKLVVIKKK